MASRDTIREVLSSSQLSVDSEKALQNQIEQLFKDRNIPYEREAKVAQGFIDFLCGDVGIEVKVKGSKRAIYRQCKGYMEDDRINSILVVSNQALALPPTINGKIAEVISLGEAWL